MKVLVFTCSHWKRSHMLRQCILNCKNQTYSDIKHSVNITLDKDATTKNFDVLYDDLIDDKLLIKYSDNLHLFINYMIAIKNVENYEDFDLFIKMDDDDIYKSKYVENIVNLFKNNENIDISTTKINYQLDGHTLHKGSYLNIGWNSTDANFYMPMTYAFTKKALMAILKPKTDDIKKFAEFSLKTSKFEDLTWRLLWIKEGLKHKPVENQDQIIWYLHNQNISRFYTNR